MTRKNRLLTNRAISLLLCLLMLLLCIPISTVAEESLGRIEETTTEGPDETVIEPPMDANADTSLSTSQGSSTAHIISRAEFERRKAAKIAAQSNASRGSLAEQEDKLIPAEELVVNEKGWLMGFDNRRINVVVDKDAQLSMNGQIIVEASTYLYDENGNFVGNVWSVGETKKMYILNHGDYEVSNTTFAKIEYMNNGYYEKIVEYSEVEKDACFTIGNYDLKTVSCEIVSAGSSTHVPATKNYTAEELTAKNQ